jgi:pilus assembly protein Flp/PilA
MRSVPLLTFPPSRREYVLALPVVPRDLTAQQERLPAFAESSFINQMREVQVAKVRSAVMRFVRDEEGAALAEYGILIAFIAIAAIVAVTFFGGKIKQKVSDLGNSFS